MRSPIIDVIYGKNFTLGALTEANRRGIFDIIQAPRLYNHRADDFIEIAERGATAGFRRMKRDSVTYRRLGRMC